MPATNNEIYKLLTEFSGKIGELTSTVKSINGSIDTLHREMAEAEATSATYRAGVRDELGKIVLRTTHLESDVSSMKNRVDDMQTVTNDVVTLRTQAQGAGTLGRWLIRIGIGVVTVAGWAVGAYTYLTGRPPP